MDKRGKSNHHYRNDRDEDSGSGSSSYFSIPGATYQGQEYYANAPPRYLASHNNSHNPNSSGYYPVPRQYEATPSPQLPPHPPQTWYPHQQQQTPQMQYSNEYYGYNYSSSPLPYVPVTTSSSSEPPSGRGKSPELEGPTEATPSSTNNKRKTSSPPVEDKKSATTITSIMVGKRRGKGKALPTGVVKKAKTDEPEAAKDSWSQYLSEVKKYKDQSCEDDRKNRPLVK